MYLENLILHDFRNYADLEVTFSQGVNVLLGENAQGKTNLLEAIYVLALTRSHRTANDKELIRWQTQTATLKGRLHKATGSVPLELELGRRGKRARVNHLEQAKLSQYIGNLNVIVFAPEDLSIVKGAPAVRRRFMDMEFGQMSPKYLYNLSQYRTILKQRNQYLRQLNRHQAKDKVYLSVLSDQLAAFGAEIIHKRLELLQQLEQWAQGVHSEITQQQEHLTFHYVTQVEPADQTSSTTFTRLYKNCMRNRKPKKFFKGRRYWVPTATIYNLASTTKMSRRLGRRDSNARPRFL